MLRILLLMVLFPLSAAAQQKLSLSFLGGFANYSGDLQEKRFTLDQSHLGVGAGLSYEVAPRVLVRGELKYGKIGADDKYSTDTMLLQRNLNFQSQVFEASLMGDFSLFDLSSRTRTFTPYIFAGISLYRFNPYTYDAAGSKTYLRDLGTEGQGLPQHPDRKPYKLIQVGIPFGGGIRFKITDNAYLGYEIGLRKLFTDYLDDVSTTYADEAALLAGNGARAVELAFRGDELKDNPLSYPVRNTVRGGAKYKDWYYFSGITLSIGLFDDNIRLFSPGTKKGSVDCPPPLP